MENKKYILDEYYYIDTINETIKKNFTRRGITPKIENGLLQLITFQQEEKQKFTDFVNLNFEKELAKKFIEKELAKKLAKKFIEYINEKYNDDLNKVLTTEEYNYKNKPFDLDNSIKNFLKKKIYKNINFAINRYTDEIIEYINNDEMIEKMIDELYGISYADNNYTERSFKDLLKKTRFFGLLSRKGGRKSKKSKKSKKTKTRRRK